MTYNALDVHAKVIEAKEQLILEIADVEANFDYWCATGGRYAPTDDEVSEHDKYIGYLRNIIKAIAEYDSYLADR